MIVRELVTRLGFSVADGNLKKYESGVNNIKNSAEQAANSFRNMFAAFLGFSALQSLANTADTMQSLEARVGMLPQTVDDAGTAFDTVAKRASAARQSIDAYANLYIKLQNAGDKYIKTQEEGLQITDTLSKALVVGGATAQEQASAMLQFAQAIGSGVLQGDELRAMAEASPMFMAELAKAMNIPKEQIKKMGSEGKLTSQSVVEAVKKMTGAFDERFKQMPMTIKQALTIVENRWGMFVNNLNRKSGTVTKIADFLLTGFDKIESGLGKIVDFFGGATNAVKLFGIVLGAALAPLLGGAVVAAFGALLNPVTWVVAGLVALGVVLEDVYQFFTGGESVIGDFISWLKEGSDAAKMLTFVVGVLTTGLGFLGTAFVLTWAAALSPITLIIAGIVAATTAIIYFKDKILEAWNSLKSFFGFASSGVNVNSTTVAGAAASSGGTGGVKNNNQTININQTLPPGSTPETAAAAKDATKAAIKESDASQMARQMGMY